MKLNSETNKLFRLAIIISFLLIIWFPNYPCLIIITLGLVLIENTTIKQKVDKLGIFLLSGVVITFFLPTPTSEEQIYTTIVTIIVAFIDEIKKPFKSERKLK
ncbi:hypothetical protein [Cytobacillus massiliigabonensis]|uniref:hypothetical protein n=1 Tax=Cytobacillus massiliigabonensis TaxID=1871011 RepID=UPI000C86053D|nr:hypothetical protein [Cytobacillus massiliigabonensis]